MASRVLLYDIGKEFKKSENFVYEAKRKYFQQMEKSISQTENRGRGEYPPVYPLAKDDPDKLIKFLKETFETINWIISNWNVYIAEKTIPLKPLLDMWKFAKGEFDKIIKLLSSDVIETLDSNKSVDIKKELKKKGLTNNSLESKLLLVDFGHVEMLLAYDDYENSSKTIKEYSKTSKIASKIGRTILKIRKLENQSASSKWLSAAIIIIGSILDVLDIKSPLTEFLEALSLTLE